MPDSITLLVADTSLKVRRLVRAAADQAGTPITVIEAANGRSCREHFDEGRIDLAFVDPDMPGLSEPEFLREVSRSGRKIFVTVMSKPESGRIFDFAEKLNAFEFLVKPFSQDEVSVIIETYRRLAKPRKVLIFDDSPSIRQIIAKILSASVYRLEIEQASDEATALSRCRKGDLDIVFLNWDTSEPGDLDCLERIVGCAPETKVVMMSVEHNPWQERGALRRGAAAFLHKPFYPADIDVILHRLCGMDLSKLTSKAGSMVAGFDVRVLGRTVTATHRDSGHSYQFLWFRDQPYLRAANVHDNEFYGTRADDMRADAEAAALVELDRAKLLNPPPQALAG